MGLSNYPTQAEGGILFLIVMNAATFISFIKGILLSILHSLGINISKVEEDSTDSLSCSYEPPTSKSCVGEFQKTTSPIRYDSVNKFSDSEQECTVCLTKFEQDSLIHLLSCGHVFHKTCLETWLRYWYVTCPLCRTQIIPLIKEECNNIQM